MVMHCVTFAFLQSVWSGSRDFEMYFLVLHCLLILEFMVMFRVILEICGDSRDSAKTIINSNDDEGCTPWRPTCSLGLNLKKLPTLECFGGVFCMSTSISPSSPIFVSVLLFFSLSPKNFLAWRAVSASFQLGRHMPTVITATGTDSREPPEKKWKFMELWTSN